MTISETVTGNDSIAVVGIDSAGERTLGISGHGDSVGVQGIGKGWNGVKGLSPLFAHSGDEWSSYLQDA